LALFIESRRDGLSARTIEFYSQYLEKAVAVLGLAPSTAAVNRYLSSLPCSPGGKHAYYRAMRVFYNWLYSPKAGLGFEGKQNPITWVEAPKTPKVILPSLSKEELQLLISKSARTRDKAIISLFAESGLRLTELVNIRPTDIDWTTRTIRVVGKGNKEALAPFGLLSEQYMRQWMAEFQPNGGTLWGLTRWQVISVLDELRRRTGLPCNPHTFRRTFACLLRKAGVDSLTIKDLGRWESLEMVQRYTRSVTFEDALKHYRAPLGE
jgi:site-specific recombinase XerD